MGYDNGNASSISGKSVSTTAPSGGDVLIFNDVSQKYEPGAGVGVNVNKQTGTAYTAALSDKNSVIEMNNNSANTVTIPTNASVAYSIGTTLTIIQYGAGATTAQGDTGVTINGASAGSEVTTAQYEGLSLYKSAINEWVVINK